MVALESMACGTPVIATKVGGLELLVQDEITGLSVPDDDPESLAVQLKRMLCKEGLRKELSKNCLEFAQGFSWSIITRELIEIYQRMAAGSNQNHPEHPSHA